MDPRVKGNLTLVSEGQVPAHQAYDMLLAALRMQGFSVVDVGGVAQVDARGRCQAAWRADVQCRQQRHADPHLSPAIRKRGEPDPGAAPHRVAQQPDQCLPRQQQHRHHGLRGEPARVAQIISGIDTPSAIDTDVVQIQNGIAVDIAAMVAELLETQGADQTQKINVIGDPRSNSIIIRSGSPERTELARNLIYKLDNAQSNPSNMHVVYLRNAQAGKLAQSLRGLLTGESESGVSDDARGKLSSMGGSGQNSAQGGAAQNSGGTPTGSGVSPGYGQTNSTTGSNSTSKDQDTAFSRRRRDHPGGRHHQRPC